jgi:hypothetical protein
MGVETGLGAPYSGYWGLWAIWLGSGSGRLRGCAAAFSLALSIAARSLGCGHGFIAEAWSTSTPTYFRNGRDFRNAVHSYFRNRVSGDFS